MQQFRVFLFTIGAALASFDASQAATAMSDGSDGPFSPTSSMVLQRDQDGQFNFTTVYIPQNVLVSIDPLGNPGNIVLAATGDIEIHGALDVRDTALEIHTPGRITVQGKLYGKELRFVSEELELLDNPNGNPDQWLYGGVDVTTKPDGNLSIDQPYETVDAGGLAGVVTYMSIVETVPTVLYSPVEHFLPESTPTLSVAGAGIRTSTITAHISPGAGSISLFAGTADIAPARPVARSIVLTAPLLGPLGPAPAAVAIHAIPLPASALLLLSGLAGVFGFGRRCPSSGIQG